MQIVKQNETKQIETNNFRLLAPKRWIVSNTDKLIGLDWKSQFKMNNYTDLLYVNVIFLRNHVRMTLEWQKWPLFDLWKGI